MVTMPNSLEITAATIDPALLDLPWEVPLEDWPSDILAALPRGLSRHIVRFVNLSGRVIAVKEIGERVAHHEYEMLRDLSRLDAPSVLPTAVVTGRRDSAGEELNAVLVTEHLQFSLPYRALFSQYMTPDTATRLIDALAVLLVRLHLLGFYWGDALQHPLPSRCRGLLRLPRGRGDGRAPPVADHRPARLRRGPGTDEHHR